MEHRAKLRFNQGETDNVVIERGVRLGYCMSLILFNLHGEYLIKEVVYFKIGGGIVNKVRFSDDTAIIVKTQEELQDWLTMEGSMAWKSTLTNHK